MKKGFNWLAKYLGNDFERIVMRIPKISGYVKTFDDSKFMCFRIDIENLLEKIKAY